MTQKLNDLFDLPDPPEEFKAEIEILKELDAALPDDISDLSASDKEMDDLAEKSIGSYGELMDLGMNVEPRFSAPIFESASKFMGHAIQAKSNKIDKKLRYMDMQLKQRRLALQEKQAGLGAKDPEEGEARELDRNALLEMLRNKGGAA